MPNYDEGPKQVGAVLTFPRHMSKEDVRKLLQKIQKEIETVQIGEYNPEWGSPVFYVP